MNTTLLASGWQVSLAFSRELKEQNVEPSMLMSDYMWAHDPSLVLIVSSDY